MRRLLAIFVAILVTGIVGLGIYGSIGTASPWLESFFRPQGSFGKAIPLEKLERILGPERYAAADSWVREGRLLGMSIEDVRKIVGEEDSVEGVKPNETVNYYLASQKQFPAKSLLFPSRYFLNIEVWVLKLTTRDNQIIVAEIVPQ